MPQASPYVEENKKVKLPPPPPPPLSLSPPPSPSSLTHHYHHQYPHHQLQLYLHHPASTISITITTVIPLLTTTTSTHTHRLHGQDNSQIKSYYVSFWNGVDLRYKLLKGPRVKISIAGIIISRVGVLGRSTYEWIEIVCMDQYS